MWFALFYAFILLWVENFVKAAFGSMVITNAVKHLALVAAFRHGECQSAIKSIWYGQFFCQDVIYCSTGRIRFKKTNSQKI